MQHHRAITWTSLSGAENMDCISIGDWKIRHFQQQVKRNFREMYNQSMVNWPDIFSIACVLKHYE